MLTNRSINNKTLPISDAIKQAVPLLLNAIDLPPNIYMELFENESLSPLNKKLELERHLLKVSQMSFATVSGNNEKIEELVKARPETLVLKENIRNFFDDIETVHLGGLINDLEKYQPEEYLARRVLSFTAQQMGIAEFQKNIFTNYISRMSRISEKTLYLEIYLNVGCDVNGIVDDSNQLTLLHYLVGYRNEAQAKYVLNHYQQTINFKAQDITGATILIYAVRKFKSQLVNILLSCPGVMATINMQDKEDRTALHYAYILGQSDVIDMLESHAADNNIIDKYKRIPASYALCPDQEIIRVFNDFSTDPWRNALASFNNFYMVDNITVGGIVYEKNKGAISEAADDYSKFYLAMMKYCRDHDIHIPNPVKEEWSNSLIILAKMKENKESLLDKCIRNKVSFVGESFLNSAQMGESILNSSQFAKNMKFFRKIPIESLLFPDHQERKGFRRKAK